MSDEHETPAFEIFRAATAPSLEEAGVMVFEGVTPGVDAQVSRLREAGVDDGNEVKILINLPGFHLSHSWFKCGFPLPVHSHDSSCLYYIVAGSLRLGTETLGAGDGFFVRKDTPYGYTPGPDGVEVLEFRHDTAYNFRFFAKESAAFWDRAVEQLKDNHPKWAAAVPPTDRLKPA